MLAERDFDAILTSLSQEGHLWLAYNRTTLSVRTVCMAAAKAIAL